MDDPSTIRHRGHRRAPSRGWRGLLIGVLLVGLAAGSVGCSGAQTAGDEEATESVGPPERAGNDGWEGGALELPARAPIVATLRTDELLRNARGLRRWLIEEPEMFGPDGESFTQGLRQGWNQLATGLGHDPLSDETPASIGVDVERSMYLGLYPADAVDGRKFVERLESTARRELDLDEDVSLRAGLREIRRGEGDLPTGFHKRVTDAVGDLRPRAGFRLVVPVADAEQFVGELEAVASIAGYETIEMPELSGRHERDSGPPSPYASRRSVRGFVRPDARWPIVAVRTEGEWAKIDALFQAFDRGGSGSDRDDPRDRLREDLRTMIERFATGRPLAPKAVDSPFVSVGADQQTTSEFARMQAYKEVLETVAAAGVDKRNRALATGLRRATTIGAQWSAAAEQLSGVSYGLHGLSGDQDDHYARLEMTLFGPAPSREIALETGAHSLRIGDRAAGMSMALDPLFSEAWNEWLGLEDLSELVGNSGVASDYPGMYLLSIPRNLALFLVNGESLVERLLPEPLAPLFERRRELETLEIATAGADLRSLRTDPKLVGLMTFDSEAPADRIEPMFEMFPPLAALGFRLLDRSEASAPDNLDRARNEIARNELQAFELPEDHLAHPFHYYAHTRAPGPFVFFSRGLNREDADREVGRLLDDETGDRTANAFFARLEPAALTSLLTSYDPDALAPLQPGILVQRLGAFELAIHPEREGDVQRLHYHLDLRKPPEL